MISEQDIIREELTHLKMQFGDKIEEVRLNGEERRDFRNLKDDFVDLVNRALDLSEKQKLL